MNIRSIKILATAFTCMFFSAGWMLDAKPEIIPAPASMEISSTEYFPLDKVIVNCEDASSVAWAQNHFNEWYGEYAPAVKRGKNRSDIDNDEGYVLTVDEKGIQISAKTIQGVRYALYSLRQVTMPKRGTLEVEGWISPKMTVKDSPKSSFRGMHICWFRETKIWEVERAIRLAAYYKMNYAVIESWGTFKSEIAPWYCWPDAEMTKEEIARLRGIADDLGITLIPQLNVFGHASGARGGGGKHAVFSVNPQYQTLFEPDNGWNWCLTNPEARRIIIGLLKELHEDFGRPPFIHIGGDEADEPSCPECLKRPFDEIFLEHLNAIDKAVNEMGARPMMWQDMLLQRGDERWKGFYANGSEATAKAALTLPKDIVICDWFYGEPKESYPTMSYFQDLGYQVVATPWNNYKGMVPQVKYNQEHNMFGVLGTLWHHFYGSELRNIFFHTAMMAWYGDIVPISSMSTKFFTHLHHVCWDMKATDMNQYGIFYYDVPYTPSSN
ncbi:MAG: family 20 glycosylhydrolase [Alistipes sp.]|nr:family 20 glycosylhydrolase [Candidatus Minthomonas equi]